MSATNPASLARPDGDERPWERPGAVRRDCEPHRGRLLAVLGLASSLCGLLSLALGLPGLVGLAAGACARGLARRDLARMRTGLMDPTGEDAAEHARRCGLAGMGLSVGGLVLHAAAYALLLASGGWARALLLLLAGGVVALALFVIFTFAVIHRAPPEV